MRGKIICIFVCTLLFCTVLPLAQSYINQDFEIQQNSLELDIVIPQEDIKVTPSANWNVADEIRLTFTIINGGIEDYRDLLLDVHLVLAGCQGLNGEKFLGQNMENKYFDLAAGEIKHFYIYHEVTEVNFIQSQTCINISIHKGKERVTAFLNEYYIKNTNPSDPFLGVIPFINPLDEISTIIFDLQYLEGFPEEWNAEIEFLSLENVESGDISENIITIYHNGYLEPGTFGKIFIELHAMVEFQDDPIYIGDVTIYAVVDDIEPTLEIIHPTNSIYFMGSKLLPYLHPFIIGSGFGGEFHITDDTVNFAWVFLDGELIHLDTISDHPHFELPAGPIFGLKRISIEVYDKALNRASMDINALILKMF